MTSSLLPPAHSRGARSRGLSYCADTSCSSSTHDKQLSPPLLLITTASPSPLRYQVLEARVHGADTLLLIVAILGVRQLADLMQYSRSLGTAHDSAIIALSIPLYPSPSLSIPLLAGPSFLPLALALITLSLLLCYVSPPRRSMHPNEGPQTPQ